MSGVSVVIPAYNEAGAVGETVARVKAVFAATERECEVIVVDDGSGDQTALEAEQAGAVVLRHPRNIGYGNAIMTGVRHAHHPLIATTDADGTYPIDELPSMVDELEQRGLDMLIGARQGKHYRGHPMKALARFFFKLLAEFTTGTRIPDINSGLRVFRRELVDTYAPVICGGFSFSTTITVIALLTHHFVAFRPVPYFRRVGASKVRYFRDTLRAAQILTMAIVVFNPIKLFMLLAGGCFAMILPLAVVVAVWPHLAAVCLLIGGAAGIATLVMGQGFLAEQRRASPQGVFSFPKHPRVVCVSKSDDVASVPTRAADGPEELA